MTRSRRGRVHPDRENCRIAERAPCGRRAGLVIYLSDFVHAAARPPPSLHVGDDHNAVSFLWAAWKEKTLVGLGDAFSSTAWLFSKKDIFHARVLRPSLPLHSEVDSPLLFGST